MGASTSDTHIYAPNALTTRTALHGHNKGVAQIGMETVLAVLDLHNQRTLNHDCANRAAWPKRSPYLSA